MPKQKSKKIPKKQTIFQVSKRKYPGLSVLMGVCIGLIILFVFSVVAQKHQTTRLEHLLPTVTPIPTQNPLQTYTNSQVGFSFQYPNTIQLVADGSFANGVLMVNTVADGDTTKGLGADFDPNNYTAVRYALASNTAYDPRDGSWAGRFTTQKLGDNTFIRVFPVTGEGCFCHEVEYVTRVGNYFVTLSMAKALIDPPNGPTLAPYQKSPVSNTEFGDKLPTQQEALLKEIFGNIEDIVKTFHQTHT